MILSPHVCDTNKIGLLKSQTLPVWCHLDSRKYPSLIAGGYPQPWNHHGIWNSWGLTKNPKHRREEITAIPTYHVLPSNLVIYIVCTARNLEFCRRDHGISNFSQILKPKAKIDNVQKRPIFGCKIVSYIYMQLSLIFCNPVSFTKVHWDMSSPSFCGPSLMALSGTPVLPPEWRKKRHDHSSLRPLITLIEPRAVLTVNKNSSSSELEIAGIWGRWWFHCDSQKPWKWPSHKWLDHDVELFMAYLIYYLCIVHADSAKDFPMECRPM